MSPEQVSDQEARDIRQVIALSESISCKINATPTDVACGWPLHASPWVYPLTVKECKSASEVIQRDDKWLHEPPIVKSIVAMTPPLPVTQHPAFSTPTASSSSSSSSPTPVTPSAQCCVCMDAPPTQAPLPCAHLCLCARCADSIMKSSARCPMCQTHMDKHIHVYT